MPWIRHCYVLESLDISDPYPPRAVPTLLPGALVYGPEDWTDVQKDAAGDFFDSPNRELSKVEALELENTRIKARGYKLSALEAESMHNAEALQAADQRIQEEARAKQATEERMQDLQESWVQEQEVLGIEASLEAAADEQMCERKRNEEEEGGKDMTEKG
ncbi:MAG: hypothetical protein Q9166_001994 [cf. Caloplaca sp. 2 TL-2023]